MDAAEVRRMNSYLSQLARAIQYYDEKKFKVNFEQGNIFCYSLDEKNGEWIGEEKPLPLTSYQFMHLEITSEKFIKDFCETPQDDCGLDIHIECLPFFIDDAEYERPGIVRMLMLADTDSGMILGTEILHPDEVEGEALVNYLVSLMFDSGRPREIRVCNDIIKHYISSLCKVGNIKLRKVKKIPIFQKFIEGLPGLPSD